MERNIVERYLQHSEDYRVKELATALIAEMDKQKIPEIDWESRPWATEVRIAYCTKDCPPYHIGDRIATIKRPKSHEREIAEKKAEKYLEYYGGQFDDAKERLVNDIESAINEYKEWEANR